MTMKIIMTLLMLFVLIVVYGIIEIEYLNIRIRWWVMLV